MKKIYTAMVVLATVFAWGCVKQSGPGSSNVVPANFDFATTSVCDLSIDYNLSGHTKASVIDVYAENPYVSQETRELKGIEPLLSAFVDKDGKFSGKVRVPKCAETVFVKTNAMGAANLIELPVNNGTIAFDAANVANAAEVSATRANENYYGFPSTMKVLQTRRDAGYKAKDGYLDGGNWDKNGKPGYLVTNTVIRTGLLAEIRGVLKEGSRLPNTQPQLMDGGNKVINVYEECDLEMVFLHEDCNFLNTLGYYTYPTGQEPTDLSQIKAFTIAFPNASLGGGGGNLASGNTVKIKYWDGSKFVDKFPKGTTVAFFIVSNGFKTSTYEVGAGYATFYSNYNLVNKQKQQMVAFRDSKNEISIIGVEDSNRNGSSDEDFNDVVFYVKSNPAKATDVPGNDPEPENPPQDDPVETTTTYKGTLIFEDLWPSQGDYDLNDVVVEYTCNITVNAYNRVIRIVDNFRPVNCGAELQNGFAVQYGFDQSAPASMKIETNYPGGAHKYHYTPIAWQVDAKGYEVGQNKATILLFEDIRQKELASGAYSWTVTTLFDEYRPTLEEVGTPPYNPFIINMRGSSGDLRGREIHLTNHQPTIKGTYALFGTANDISVAPNYYVSNDNYPFAIDLPIQGFVLPVEKQRIETLYPQYHEWAKSKGAVNKEWYKQAPAI